MVVKDPQLGAITKVQQETVSSTIDIMDQDEMVHEIQNMTEECQLVCFLTNTEFALKLVSGQTKIPSDIDGPTRQVLNEMK